MRRDASKIRRLFFDFVFMRNSSENEASCGSGSGSNVSSPTFFGIRQLLTAFVQTHGGRIGTVLTVRAFPQQKLIEQDDGLELMHHHVLDLAGGSPDGLEITLWVAGFDSALTSVVAGAEVRIKLEKTQRNKYNMDAPSDESEDVFTGPRRVQDSTSDSGIDSEGQTKPGYRYERGRRVEDPKRGFFRPPVWDGSDF